MPPTTGYSFGDIALVSFPFTDQSTVKRRPAVVVSAPRTTANQQKLRYSYAGNRSIICQSLDVSAFRSIRYRPATMNPGSCPFTHSGEILDLASNIRCTGANRLLTTAGRSPITSASGKHENTIR